ncbi:MAG: hypothetical protein ACI97D_001206, partial [Porticoccaceae bacterium]
MLQFFCFQADKLGPITQNKSVDEKSDGYAGKEREKHHVNIVQRHPYPDKTGVHE